MVEAAIFRVRKFLSSWQNLLALGTLPALGVWIYSRVWMVNPAILGDEYLYSMNARKAGPWDAPAVGDFSNYLFNLVYQGTNLCSDSFYSCVKILNIWFFLGFIWCLFIVGKRLAGYWVGMAGMLATGLSPLSVYTSMFLPESMYLFFMGLLFLSLMNALRTNSTTAWALAGFLIGISSLVKPHAWLTFIALAVAFLATYPWGQGQRPILTIGRKILSVIAAAVAARIVAGFVVAGPKGIAFFGQYVGVGTLQTFTNADPNGIDSGDSYVGAGPLQGVGALFVDQLSIHSSTLAALATLQVMVFFAVVVKALRTRELSLQGRVVLATGIWTLVLMLEIVIFTGWVTGGGDDHTTRVLLRYYEFMVPITLTAALAYLFSGGMEKYSALQRWGISGAVLFIVTPSFTGMFNDLTIQIADAPSVAGLIVSQQVFSLVGVGGFAILLAFATFPRLVPLGGLVFVMATSLLMGVQTVNQYQIFRGSDGVLDEAGKATREIAQSLGVTSAPKVFATSRFDATGAAFWIDDKETAYEVFIPGALVTPALVGQDYDLVLLIGMVFEGEGFKLVAEGEGYSLHSRVAG